MNSFWPGWGPNPTFPPPRKYGFGDYTYGNPTSNLSEFQCRTRRKKIKISIRRMVLILWHCKLQAVGSPMEPVCWNVLVSHSKKRPTTVLCTNIICQAILNLRLLYLQRVRDNTIVNIRSCTWNRLLFLLFFICCTNVIGRCLSKDLQLL